MDAPLDGSSGRQESRGSEEESADGRGGPGGRRIEDHRQEHERGEKHEHLEQSAEAAVPAYGTSLEVPPGIAATTKWQPEHHADGPLCRRRFGRMREPSLRLRWVPLSRGPSWLC